MLHLTYKRIKNVFFGTFIKKLWIIYNWNQNKKKLLIDGWINFVKRLTCQLFNQTTKKHEKTIHLNNDANFSFW